MDNHQSKVERVAKALQQASQRGQTAHITKKGVPHFVPLPGDKRFAGQPVYIGDLCNVLEIDVKKRTCVAEPGVTFAQLVQETLPHGLVPGVVPELEGITVGGAISGCSIESMSHKVGGFHDNCLEYEVVSGDGQVMTCSPDKDPLLFEMMHGSYGTLGIVSKATFKLYPAKPYVKMSYERFADFDSFYRRFQFLCDSGESPMVDAIIHAPDQLVLCLAQFVDEVPYISSYRWLDIYYKSTLRRRYDYLTSFDYFFRYDTECHWLTKTIPLLESKPVRFALGKLVLGSTNLIQWSQRLDPILKLKKRPEVVCDVFIPACNFAEFWQWYKTDFDFYPLWVIPYRSRPYAWINDDYAKGFKGDLFYDCAVYGKANHHPGVDYSELLEQKTVELNGLKTLISRNHFSRETFWSVYNKTNYDQAKQTLDPKGVFQNLYDQFHSNA